MHDAWIDRFLALQSSPLTRRVYASELYALREFSTRQGWTFPFLAEEHALTWRAHLDERHLAPATIARKLAIARTFFNFLLDLDAPPQGLPSRNPFRRIRPPRFDRSLGKTPCPSPEEVQRLLSVIDPRSAIGLRDRVIMLFLFNQGLRVSEVARSERENIRRYRKFTYLALVGKGGSEIRSVLAPALARLLGQHLERQGRQGRFLFTSLGGHRGASDHPLTSRTIHARLKHYARLAGLDPTSIRPHSGRVFFITQSYLKTHDLERVARAVGHREIATTRRYLRLNEILETHPALLIDLSGASRHEGQGTGQEAPLNIPWVM